MLKPISLGIQWLQNVCTLFMQHACQGHWDVLLCLCVGPDFKTLSQLSQVLQGTPVSLSPQLLEGYSRDVLQKECQKMLQELQALGYFRHARQVADLAGLSIDDLIITEVCWCFHSALWAFCVWHDMWSVFTPAVLASASARASLIQGEIQCMSVHSPAAQGHISYNIERIKNQ